MAEAGTIFPFCWIPLIRTGPCRHYSTYLNNMFTAAQLARFQQQETPFYCYDTGLLRETVNACKLAAGKRDFHVHYALKANVRDELLQIILEGGFGADCVSSGEVEKAVETGDRKSTRLNSSHSCASRMPSSAC